MLKLRVTDIKQYVYCPRILYFTYVCPVDKKTTRKMQYGKEAHLELDRLEKRRSFKRYDFSTAERKYHTHLYSPRLGLEGRLDMHLLAKGEVFPVEFKYTQRGPSLNHKYQLISYAMLLEDAYGKPVRYGFLHLHPAGEVIPIEVTDNSRLFIKDVMDKIRTLVQKELMPSPTPNKLRCIDCEYRNFCNDVR